VRYRDGEPTGMEERWVLGEIRPGVVRVRSTLVTPSPVGRLETDVRVQSGLIEAQLRWTGSGSGSVQSGSGRYVGADGVVSGSWQLDDDEPRTDSAVGLLDPSSLIMSGRVIATARAGLDLVMPDQAAPGDRERFLSLFRVTATSTLREEVEVEVDGVAHPALAYDWQVTGVGPVVVVDRGGLLLHQRVTTPDGRTVEARLVGVSGPWPRPFDWPT
jgi:hypothetical protein